MAIRLRVFRRTRRSRDRSVHRAQRPRSVQSAKRDDVIGAEHGGRRPAELEQITYRVVARGVGELSAPHQRWIQGAAQCGETASKPRQPGSARTRVVWPSDVGDPFMASRNQDVGGDLRSANVVDHARVNEARKGLAIEHHGGDALLGECLGRLDPVRQFVRMTPSSEPSIKSLKATGEWASSVSSAVR